MSQHTIKSQRRYIRKIQHESYEATLKGLAVSEARLEALRSFLRPKPRIVPAFAWTLIQKIVIKLP